MLSNLSKIIKDCHYKNYFDADSLFLKKTKQNGVVTIIAIDKSIKNSNYEDIKLAETRCTLYRMNNNVCLSLILNKDLLISSLFSETVCLKDDLKIARSILLAINPIINTTNNIDVKSIDPKKIWDYSRFISPLDIYPNELSVNFHGIDCDVKFFKNTLIPLLSSLNEVTANFSSLVQFYNSEDRINASYTIFLESPERKNKLLLNMQKYFYLNSLELNMEYIDIPAVRTHSIFDRHMQLFYYVADIVTEFQSIIISSYNKKDISINLIVTELTYLYIEIAKRLYDNKKDFLKSNIIIRNIFINRYISDNIKFLLSNNIITKYRNKIDRQQQKLCMLNISQIYDNYCNTLNDWENKGIEKIEYTKILNKIDLVKSYLIEKDELGNLHVFFVEITKKIFSSFNIVPYYKSYIPYTIIFLKNEF